MHRDVFWLWGLEFEGAGCGVKDAGFWASWFVPELSYKYGGPLLVEMAGADQLLLCRTMHTNRCLSHVAQPRVGDFESRALIGRNLATDHREYADQMSACLPMVSDHTERDHGWGFPENQEIRRLFWGGSPSS